MYRAVTDADQDETKTEAASKNPRRGRWSMVDSSQVPRTALSGGTDIRRTPPRHILIYTEQRRSPDGRSGFGFRAHSQDFLVLCWRAGAGSEMDRCGGGRRGQASS